MVATLIPSLQMCRELSPHALGSAMCWFKRLGDTPEMLHLASVLTPKVLGGRRKIDLKAFSNTMYQLQDMCHSKEVQEFLLALDPLMEIYFDDLPEELPNYFILSIHEC
jgi:hypothetical protein